MVGSQFWAQVKQPAVLHIRLMQ